MNASTAVSYTVGLVMLLVAVTAAIGTLPAGRQSRLGQDKTGAPCSKNMACQWAVCPWSRDYMHLIPSPSFCLIIPNHCECQSGSKCTLTNNTKPGATLVRHEYRCVSQDKWHAMQQQSLVS